jgi:hypothetical protein
MGSRWGSCPTLLHGELRLCKNINKMNIDIVITIVPKHIKIMEIQKREGYKDYTKPCS